MIVPHIYIILPQIISFTKDEVSFCVESRTHFTESTVAAAALQTVLMPEHVQGFQQKSGKVNNFN